MAADRIDSLVQQWKSERADLDLEAMALVARLLGVAGQISRRIDRLAKEHDMSAGEGDVLFTLRRAGAPYRLSPTTLAQSLLVTSGTMTNRLDRLEERELIVRTPNPTDRRAIGIALTDAGRKLVDEAITRHVESEIEMLAVLSPADRRRLSATLKKLGAHLEST